MKPEIEKAIKLADKRLLKERRPMIVYKRHGSIAVLPYASYLDLDLDDKGARRIAVRTMNAKGDII